MPTPTTYPSAKQVLGLAVETTQGTAVTTLAATCPVAEFKPVDKFVMLEDNALRGSMARPYGIVQGPRSSEVSGSGPVFTDWLPFFLRNILGDLVTTGAGPYTHAISTLNSGTAQPSSLTLIDWQGPTPTTQSRVYNGVCLSELTLKGNPESTLLEWGFKGMGWSSSAFPTSPPSFSPGTEAPMAAWRTGIGLGGTYAGAPNLTIREWEVTITRALKVEWTSQNAQVPYIIQRGEVTVAGSLHYSVPSDETALNYYLNNTQPQLQILADNGQASTAQRRLTIDIQASAFDGTEVDRSEEAVGYQATFKAVANTTNVGASGGYSSIKTTVINNTSSY